MKSHSRLLYNSFNTGLVLAVYMNEREKGGHRIAPIHNSLRQGVE